MLQTQLGVFTRVDAFQDKFAFPVIAHARDEFPVHCWIGTAQFRIVDAIAHRAVAADFRPALVTCLALVHVFGACTVIRFAESPGGVVASKRQYRHAIGLKTPHQLHARIPGIRRIKLLPHGTAMRFGNVFNGKARRGGQHLHVVAGTRGTRNRDFALRVKRALPTCGAGENRAAVSATPPIHTGIDLGGVTQAARTQLQLAKAFAIGEKRGIVIRATRHV